MDRRLAKEDSLAKEYRKEADPPEVSSELRPHVHVPPVFMTDAATSNEIVSQPVAPDGREQANNEQAIALAIGDGPTDNDNAAHYWRPTAPDEVDGPCLTQGQRNQPQSKVYSAKRRRVVSDVLRVFW